MHELTRRAYLASMGIESYVSRGQLPGAAPGRRLVVVRQAAPEDRLNVGKPSPQAATLAIPLAPDTTTQKAPLTKPAAGEPGQSREMAPQPAAMQSFSIVAIACGGWLWLEELSSSEVSRHQVHLIRSIVRALGLENESIEISQFNWPIHRNTQLDLGEDAARASLGGFVKRRAEQYKCSGVILMGNSCRQRLEANNLDLGQCIHTLATAQMLLDPLLKKRAWLDLLAIRSRS